MFLNPKFELLSSVFHIINKKRFESNTVHFIVCISYFNCIGVLMQIKIKNELISNGRGFNNNLSYTCMYFVIDKLQPFGHWITLNFRICFKTDLNLFYTFFPLNHFEKNLDCYLIYFYTRWQSLNISFCL